MNILDKIVANKIKELPVLKEEFKKITPSSRPREIIKLSTKKKFIITEIKIASPSEGIIIPAEKTDKIFNTYKESNTDAISVVIDRVFFKGDPCIIRRISTEFEGSILFKEFIIDPWQIDLAYGLGADIILLIVSILSEKQLKLFYEKASLLNLQTLFEVHSYSDIEKLEKITPEIVGINNRDLKTFKIDINKSLELSKMLPTNCIKIAESGIKTAEDIKQFIENKFNGFLIGTSILKDNDPLKKLKELKNALQTMD